MPTKYCSGCNKTKSIDDFTNDKKSKDGKTGKCKKCRNKNDRLYRTQYREKTLAQNRENSRRQYAKKKKAVQSGLSSESSSCESDNNTKYCNGCELNLPFSNFNKDKYSKDGYTTRCKGCRKKSKKEWADNNRSHIIEYKRNWREKNKEKH